MVFALCIEFLAYILAIIITLIKKIRATLSWMLKGGMFWEKERKEGVKERKTSRIKKRRKAKKNNHISWVPATSDPGTLLPTLPSGPHSGSQMPLALSGLRTLPHKFPLLWSSVSSQVDLFGPSAPPQTRLGSPPFSPVLFPCVLPNDWSILSPWPLPPQAKLRSASLVPGMVPPRNLWCCCEEVKE